MMKTTWLDWDTEVLGFGVARIDASSLDESALRDTLLLLSARGAHCIYFSAQGDDLATQQAALACGGTCVDLKLTYQRTLSGLSWDTPLKVEDYEQAMPGPELIALAYEIGKNSRFYADPYMPRDAYQRIYSAWMHNAVNRTVADAVKVIQYDAVVAGVVTLVDKGDYGNISLIAVDSEYHGQGLGNDLIQAALAWSCHKGHTRSEVVTQKTNTKACALYQRHGFALKTTEYFYHFWPKKNII